MSEAGFPEVPIGTVAQLNQRAETTEPSKTYRQIGVKLWGTGAYERESVKGTQTKYKTLFLMEEGDIVVNKIWARNGSVAVVTDELAGSYGSNEFPTFTPDRSQLDPKWFHWITKARFFWERCDEQSRGTSGQNRIKPEKFLRINVPLPPLSEQRRIVERLEQLASKIEEARGLRDEAEIEIQACKKQVVSTFFSNKDWHEVPLGQLLIEDSRNGLAPRPSDSPPGVPILRISAATSREDGVIDEGDHKYLDVQESDLRKYALRPGDLLACRFNGNLRFVGKFSVYKGYSQKSQVYPDKLIRFRVDATMIIPEFACLALGRSRSREAIESFCATTAGNIGISASNLKTVLVPVPLLGEQQNLVKWVSTLQAKVDSLKQLQAQTRGELDALLPSILDKAFRGEL